MTSALRRLLSRKPPPELARSETFTHVHAHFEQVHAAVLEEMAEALYVVDGDGRLVMMNAAASRLLGWSEDDLLGRPVHELVHRQRANGSPLPVEECDLTNAYRRGKAVNGQDDVFTHKNGSIVPVSYSLSPLVDASGARGGAVVVFRERRERARTDADAGRWVRRIREALDEERLELYAQPILPLDGGAPREELLLRMLDEDGGVIAPRDFMGIAERARPEDLGGRRGRARRRRGSRNGKAAARPARRARPAARASLPARARRVAARWDRAGRARPARPGHRVARALAGRRTRRGGPRGPQGAQAAPYRGSAEPRPPRRRALSPRERIAA